MADTSTIASMTMAHTTMVGTIMADMTMEHMTTAGTSIAITAMASSGRT